MNFKRYLKGAWEGADFWDKKENNDQGQQRAAAQPAKLPQSDKPNRGLVGVLKGAANQVNPFDGGRTWDTSRRNVNPGTPNKVKINDNTPGFQFSNNSLTRGLSRGWDQANILDSGRSWKTRTPDDIQRNQSGLSQAGKTLLPASGKFLNTAGLAGEQVINTTRMLAAQASNNQEALRNSIKASDDDYERYTKPGAGIFGTGTYFRSADEAKSGDFKTVAKRIGGGIAETGFEVASLGVGSFAGKKALDTAGKAGIKKAIVSQAPALAKTAVLNAGQAGASAYNQDANARGIAVSALTGAGLGTAADIGLGLGGAVAAKQAKAVATKAMPIAKDIAQESSKLFRDQGGFIANPLQPNEPIKPKIAQPSARPDPMADLPDLVVTRLSEQKTKKIPDLSTKDYNNSLKEFAEEVQAYNKLKNAQEPPIQQADKIDPLESLKQEARKLDEQVRSYDMKKNFKGFRESDDARRLVELESKLQESNKTISRLDNPVDKVTVSQIENMGRKAILEGNVSKADLVKQFNKMGKEKFPSNQKRYIDDTYGSVEAYYDDVIAKGEAGIVEQYTQFAQMPTSPKFEDFYNRTVLNRNKTGLNGNEPKINKVERKITETEPKRTEKATQSQPPKSPIESLKQEARKYKSADEFVKAQRSKVYTTDTVDIDPERAAFLKTRGYEVIKNYASGESIDLEDIATGKVKTSQGYAMTHRPNEDGARAFDLTESDQVPKDMYKNWYGSRGSSADMESIAALQKIKGKPNAEVTVYRASPSSEYNPGDWVTLSKEYAQQHADSNGAGKMQVHAKKVKAKDIRWAQDDINEFGYYPEGYKIAEPAKRVSQKATTLDDKQQLTDLYNQATQSQPPKSPTVDKFADMTPEQARANFKETWDKAYGNRPDKVRSITELDKTNYTQNGRLPDGVTGVQMAEKIHADKLAKNNLTQNEYAGLHDTAKELENKASELHRKVGDATQKAIEQSNGKPFTPKVRKELKAMADEWGRALDDHVDALNVVRKIDGEKPIATSRTAKSQSPQVGKTDPLESLKQEAKPFVIPKTNSTDVTKLLNKDLDPLPTSPVNGKYVAEEVKNVLRGAETKERGFISTIKSSDKTPSSVKSIETGTYSIKSDKQRIADAQAFIRENPAKARELALNPKSDMDVTIGNQLIDHYIATGQHKAMQEVVSGMAESGTELGRAIHAFADYDKTTPGGAVKFAEAAIRKYNKANPDKQLALQPEQVEALVNTAKQIQEMPEGRQRNIASHELINQVNELIPSTFADKALTVWKAGLLTSMRTTARNVFGNTIHGVAEIAKDVPASLADRLMALKTGNRSKTFTVKGAAQGIGEGLSHAKDMMKHGYDPTEALAGYDIKAVTWGKGPVEQGLKKYTDLVFRSLGAQDQVFYHSAFNRSLYDQALTSAKNTAKKGDDNFVDNLVKNPTEGMKVQAVIDASKATFKDENMLRDLATKVKRGLGKTEGGKVVSELVMPFVGVPSSVASQMLSYSPAGFVKGLATGSKAVRQKNSILQRQASHEIGRGTVGTGLMGLGAYLTSRGLMTGNPKDQKEAEQWKLEGKQANSVMIGGKWRSINSVGPEALLTLAGSKLESGRQNNAGMGELAGQLGKDFTQQTFLQGVQGPLNAINDPGRYGSSYVSGQVGSIIPNIVKDTAKAMDDKQRQINSPIDALKAGTPILRNNLLPKLDVLGNELKQEPSGLNNFIDLFNSKTPIKNSVIDETKKFSSADLSITPSALDKSLKESGVSIKLTPEQRTSLQKAIGTQTQAMWKETIKSPRYQSLSIEEQSKAMSKMYSDARQAEIRKFVADNQLGQYSQDFSGKPGKIDKGAKAILSGTSSVDKYLRTDTGSTIKDRYDALKDEISDKNNGWSDIKRIEKEREFAKLSVQKEYSDDLIDLYGWSKDRIKSYAENSKNPDQTIGKLLAYEDAMIKAGMLSKSKLRDKYGNLSLSSTGNSGSKGGKGRKSSKSSGGKRARKFDYKIDGFAKTAKSGKSLRQLLNEAKMRKTA